MIEMIVGAAYGALIIAAEQEDPYCIVSHETVVDELVPLPGSANSDNQQEVLSQNPSEK